MKRAQFVKYQNCPEVCNDKSICQNLPFRFFFLIFRSNNTNNIYIKKISFSKLLILEKLVLVTNLNTTRLALSPSPTIYRQMLFRNKRFDKRPSFFVFVMRRAGLVFESTMHGKVGKIWLLPKSLATFNFSSGQRFLFVLKFLWPGANRFSGAWRKTLKKVQKKALIWSKEACRKFSQMKGGLMQGVSYQR